MTSAWGGQASDSAHFAPQIASVGDSGFRVIREGQCIFASEVNIQPHIMAANTMAANTMSYHFLPGSGTIQQGQGQEYIRKPHPAGPAAQLKLPLPAGIQEEVAGG